jgi:hypothetical protein
VDVNVVVNVKYPGSLQVPARFMQEPGTNAVDRMTKSPHGRKEEKKKRKIGSGPTKEKKNTSSLLPPPLYTLYTNDCSHTHTYPILILYSYYHHYTHSTLHHSYYHRHHHHHLLL